jgi:hypothetical protein
MKAPRRHSRAPSAAGQQILHREFDVESENGADTMLRQRIVLEGPSVTAKRAGESIVPLTEEDDWTLNWEPKDGDATDVKGELQR